MKKYLLFFILLFNNTVFAQCIEESLDLFIDEFTFCVSDCVYFNYPIASEIDTIFNFSWIIIDNGQEKIYREIFPPALFFPEVKNFILMIRFEYCHSGTGDECNSENPVGTQNGYEIHIVHCPPLANFTTSTTTICAGQTIVFEDQSEKAPQNWQWEFEGADKSSSNDTLVEVRYSVPGTYDVKLIVSNPAGSDTLVLKDYITILPAPAAEVEQRSFHYQIDYGDSLQLAVCDTADDYIYSWQPTLGLSCSDCPNPVVSPSNSLQYTLTIQQDNVPCQTQCFHNITVIPSGILMPTAFSPNKDEINDVLKPVSSLAEVLLFTVYNRWGQKIYEASGSSAAWDGTFKGQDAPIGSYVWTVEYLPKDAKAPRLEQGFVVLVR